MTAYTISTFHQADPQHARQEIFNCCGSEAFRDKLLPSFPFPSETALLNKATEIWYQECTEKDWLESFTHHPKIGDVKSLTEKFAGKEQASITAATMETIQELAEANAAYEKKFGFIFIVCATGKSAEEMLRLLNDRLKNSPAEELSIAMGEQHKITIIRFKKLFTDISYQNIDMSQITTHVLDTSMGKPGQGITIQLKESYSEGWKTIAQGVTNNDGRIPDLLPPGKKLAPGSYQMVFDTGGYYKHQSIRTFYPNVEIQFTIFDESHYHIPLLISPFGYSTYRGS